MTRRHRVVVVGGGIAGLAAAHQLRASTSADIVVLDAGDRLGGHVRTVEFEGQRVDVGPEALVVSYTALLELCRTLGLQDDIVAPAAGEALLWSRGALRPLPAGLMSGMPGGLLRFARSGTVSPLGLVRAAFDLVAPRTAFPDAVTVGEIVRRRLGAEVLDRVVDPLLGGIHGGRCDELDADTIAAPIARAARNHRSLIRGLRAGSATRPSSRGGGGGGGSPFRTLRGGLDRLIDALADSVTSDPRPVELRTACPVHALHRDGDITSVELPGETIEADAVILAIPAHAAAVLVDRAAPTAAASLAEIRWSSAITCLFSYNPDDVRALPAASGVLIGRRERSYLSACTISSTKWAHLQGRYPIVKCHANGTDLDSSMGREDVVTRTRADLERIFGIRAEPRSTHVERFPHSLPQYAPGHGELVGRVTEALDDAFPNLALAGAAYHGPGLGACVASGIGAANRVVDSLRHHRSDPPVRR